jgi:hypothetical protein
MTRRASYGYLVTWINLGEVCMRLTDKASLLLMPGLDADQEAEKCCSARAVATGS